MTPLVTFFVERAIEAIARADPKKPSRADEYVELAVYAGQLEMRLRDLETKLAFVDTEHER